MPSGVRAKARQERERQAAEAVAARTAAAARVARKRQRRARFVRLLPSRTGRQSGTLAARRRLQRRLLIVALIVLNILVWLLEPSGPIRALVLVASVLAAPVLYTVLVRKA
jgi:Flp pilus assembly protein TadB